MIDKYNYNDEPSGRVDTLAMALDKCERLEKQLKIAVDGLNSIKNIQFERYLTNNGWFLAVRSMRVIVETALENIGELKK